MRRLKTLAEAIDEVRFYSPHKEDLELISQSYCEIWEGLPPLRFKKTKARDGNDALKYEGEDGYVWVPPDAYQAHRSTRTTFFSAMVTRSGNRIEAWHLTPILSDEIFIAENKARKYNRLKVIEAIEKIEKERFGNRPR
jgi:hypothetical protein